MTEVWGDFIDASCAYLQELHMNVKELQADKIRVDEETKGLVSLSCADCGSNTLQTIPKSRTHALSEGIARVHKSFSVTIGIATLSP